MQRCLELAARGAGRVAPNPMVGSVLVHEDRIIGEGYHAQFGGPHAEVHCINEAIDRGFGALLPFSRLYVSLEPCAHFGKTPPCADLIIKHRIPEVVIGSLDPFPEVDGKGIGKLNAAGVQTSIGVLEQNCLDLNRRFFCFHTRHRPYIILKWAETADGFIAPADKTGKRLMITNSLTNRLVHRWRSEEAAILVGTHTAELDDPALTTRLWPGASPVRVVLDLSLRLPKSLQVFDGLVPTIVISSVAKPDKGQIRYRQPASHQPLATAIAGILYQERLSSVLVEGGTRLLQTFLDEGCWDELRIIRNLRLKIGQGLKGPQWTGFPEEPGVKIGDDQLIYVRRD